jgi:hypothetical protein
MTQTTERSPAKAHPAGTPRFLVYALPPELAKKMADTKTCDGFVLETLPLGSAVSFVDYDGLLLVAGPAQINLPEL